MKIIYDADAVLLTPSDEYCADRGSPVKYTFIINGVIIPLCETCLKELKAEVNSI